MTKITNLTEQRDAGFIAQSFLQQYPHCFQLLGADVVMSMVEGFILRRVLVTMQAGSVLDKSDAGTIRRLCDDVFNLAHQRAASS